MVTVIGGVLAVIALLNRKRPLVLSALIIGLYILVPNLARGVYTVFLPPGAWMIVLVLFLRLMTDFETTIQDLVLKNKGVFSMIMILLAYAVLNYFTGGWSLRGFSSTILTILILPATAFALLRGASRRNPEGARKLILFVVVLGVLEGILAFIQYTTGSVIFYEKLYATAWWWKSGGKLGRVMGTTGHPIQLSVLMGIMMALTVFIRPIVLRYASMLLFLGGIIWSGGRSGILLGVVAVGFVILTERRHLLANSLFAGISIVLAVAFFQGPAGQALIKRFNDDDGSAQTRLDAYAWVGTYWRNFAVIGYQGNRDLRSSGSIKSSLENGFLMAGLNFGLAWAAILALLLIGLIFLAFRGDRMTAAVGLAAALGVVGFNLSSSFMSFSTEGFLVWALFGASLGMNEALRKKKSQQEEASAGITRPISLGDSPASPDNA